MTTHASSGAIDVVVSYAYLFRLARWGPTRLYWPVRLGLGALITPGTIDLQGTTTNDGATFAVVRADVVGLMIQSGRVFADFHLPSFAYAFTPAVNSGPALTIAHMLDWQFGATVGLSF
jgi:hypothetical protein